MKIDTPIRAGMIPAVLALDQLIRIEVLGVALRLIPGEKAAVQLSRSKQDSDARYWYVTRNRTCIAERMRRLSFVLNQMAVVQPPCSCVMGGPKRCSSRTRSIELL